MRDETIRWIEAVMFAMGLGLSAVAATDWVGYILFATTYGSP